MAKHKSDLRFCGCRRCTYGLKSKWGKFFTQYARRRYRRLVKRMCRDAVIEPYIDIPGRFPVGYTD